MAEHPPVLTAPAGWCSTNHVPHVVEPDIPQEWVPRIPRGGLTWPGTR